MIRETVETIYRALGINSPAEIDVDLVAYSQGAQVRRYPVVGCEARINGLGDKAIITVNSMSSFERQRFSIGHELGHWVKDRGSVGNLCSNEDIGANRSSNTKMRGRERTANSLAAEFLMPTSMFKPYCRDRFSYQIICELRELFQVSWTAAAIRWIDLADFPAVVVSYRQGHRKWFHRSSLCHEKVYPIDYLAGRAGTLERGDYITSHADADEWLSYTGCEDHEVDFLVWGTYPDEVVAVVWWDYDLEDLLEG